MNNVEKGKPISKQDAEKQTYAHKAILWNKGYVLAQAIVNILAESGTWEVVRIFNDDDIEKLIQATKLVDPEVVVLCQNRADEDLTLPLRLIYEQNNMIVVTVGLESNLVQVYSKESVILQRGVDLLSIMETGNFSDRILEKEVE